MSSVLSFKVTCSWGLILSSVFTLCLRILLLAFLMFLHMPLHLFPFSSLPFSLTAASLPTISSDSEDEYSEPSTVPSFFDEEVFTRQSTILEALGQGGPGKIVPAQQRLTGTPVAVKAPGKLEKWWEPTTSDADVMRMLSHPNIVSLLRVIETEQNVYLVMEVAEGEQLFHHVGKAGCLKEDKARSIFVQLLSAMMKVSLTET